MDEELLHHRADRPRILLVGIVGKNAIMLIDCALQLERTAGRCRPPRSIRRACLERFRPDPDDHAGSPPGRPPAGALEHRGRRRAGRRPLGISIVGGLVLSQALTSYTTPVVYLYLARWRRRPAARNEPASPHTSPAH